MKQTIYLLAYAAMATVMASCGMSYNIDGSSNIPGIDSKKMYLQTFRDNAMQYLDSTEIVHGQFNFSSSTDAPRMAFLQIDRVDMIVPVVIESGDITVRINSTGTVLGGTTLNERLHQFMKVRDSLMYQAAELDHEYYRAWMDQEDMAEVVNKLQQQSKQINVCLDTLTTSAITRNFDNVLGPGIFMISTLGQIPEMSPWITSIMSKAPEAFKSDPYVKAYMADVEKVLNGPAATPTQTAPAQAAAAPAAETPAAESPKAPTPREMGQPDGEEEKTE